MRSQPPERKQPDLKVFRFIRREWRAALLIVLMLIAQAACEMALPGYMSRLVDVGIQQGGVEFAVAERLSVQSHHDLKLLLSPADRALFEQAYDLKDGVYMLQVMDRQQLEALDRDLRMPGALLFMMAQQGEQGLQALRSGAMSGEAARAMAEKALQARGPQPESLLRQAASQFVRAEYERLGLDTYQMQQRYLWKNGLIMLGMTLLMGLAAATASFFTSRAAARIGRDLRSRVFHKVIGFSKAEIDRFSTASLITRSGNDIRQVEQTATMTLRMFLYAPIIGVIGIWRVAQLQSGLSWIVVVAVICAALLVGLLAGRAAPKFAVIQKLVDRQNMVTREILTGLPVIRAFTRERHEEQRFDKANRDIIDMARYINNLFMALIPSLMLVMNMTMLAIVWFGGHGIDNGTLQVGSMMAMISYTMYIIMAFMMLSMGSIMIPRANASAERILEVLDTRSDITDPEVEAVMDAPVQGRVQFDDVSFRYPEAEDDVLSHISFTAEPGQLTAIIGGTGSGKSTLINLIPRLYDVTGGSVRIDGVDVRQMKLHTLRGLIGYVPQQAVLFSGTIESNIKFAGEHIDDRQMEAAARIAQADQFISEKEDGYQSPVARGGSNVSGGQRQRLSIARALAAQPKVLLFDDSFSALDYRTDLQLRQALRREMKEASVLIVAQRIATVMQADKIIVLDQGRVVGEGRHQELLRTSRVYRAIAESQLSAEELKGGEA
jgi:ATP-binding cassette subfamily B multidrug efflux pump